MVDIPFLKTVSNFFRGKTEPPPDFENVVKVVISTFAVFVGFTINEYLKKADVEDWAQWRFWAFIALASLLLRYIIGSSVHLNHVYVKQIEGEDGAKRPRSRSVLLLFKDICFLVIFGMIAVHTTKATNLDDFVAGTLVFVGAGFVWSVFDGLVRWVWSQWDQHEGPGHFVLLWIALDVVLFVIVLSLNAHVHHVLTRAQCISGVYLLFLFLDFFAIIRAAQFSPDPAAAGKSDHAFVVAAETITDEDKFSEYRKAVPATLEAFGGKFVVRGGHLSELEGTWPHPRFVMIEFPSRRAAETWYQSPEYQKIVALRHGSSNGTLIVVDGAVD